MVEQQPSKLNTRARFPSPAPIFFAQYLGSNTCGASFRFVCLFAGCAAFPRNLVQAQEAHEAIAYPPAMPFLCFRRPTAICQYSEDGWMRGPSHLWGSLIRDFNRRRQGKADNARGLSCNIKGPSRRQSDAGGKGAALRQGQGGRFFGVTARRSRSLLHIRPYSSQLATEPDEGPGDE
jgi:hypothetical protein